MSIWVQRSGGGRANHTQIERNSMFRSFVAASAAAVALSAGAVAQDYDLSVGYDRFGNEELNIGIDTLVVRGSYFFNDNVGIEGQLNLGISDTEYQGVDLSLDYGAGVFGVVRSTVSEDDLVGVFARLGYYHAGVEASVANFSASADDGAAAGGVGVEFYVNERSAVRFDATYIGLDEGSSLVGLSYVRRFGG